MSRIDHVHHHRGQPRRDEGSALTMAIIFITVIGLAMSLALGYSSTTIKATSQAFVPARDKLYAADAATKAAVQYVVANKSEGTFTTAGTCSPERTYGTVRGESVKVQVCPQANSFTAIAVDDDYTVMARSASEVGVQVSGQGTVNVNGSVWSRTSIDVGSSGGGDGEDGGDGKGSSKSVLAIKSGTAKAVDGCTGKGTVTVDGTTIKSCTVASDPTSDPAYALETGWASTLTERTSKYCDSKTDIATLPGDSKWTGSELDDAIGSCNYVVMEPGYQYLEDIDWVIKERVVAGTIGSNDVTTAKVGEACDTTADGVTVVLGGTSTIDLSGSAASFEVCGKTITQESGKKIKLPFYGLGVPSTSSSNASLTTSTSPTGSSWTSPANAKAIDSSVASISVAKNATSGVLSLSGWNSSPAVPSGVSSLTATLNGVSNGTATFVLTLLNTDGNQACSSPTGGSAVSMPSGTSVSGSTVASFTMTCTRTLSGPYTARLTVTAPNNGSTRAVKVDGITLAWSNTTTLAKAQSGCAIKEGSKTCAVLSSDGNTNEIFLDGYVYMPNGKLDLQLPKNSLFWVTQGMVVRVLAIKVTGSTTVSPTVAASNGTINSGDVVVTATVGSATWFTCRVTFTVSGSTVTGSTITNCTRPA